MHIRTPMAVYSAWFDGWWCCHCVWSPQLVRERVGGVPVPGIHRPSSRLLRPGRHRRSVPGRVADRLPLTATRQPPTVHPKHQPRLPLRLDGWTLVRGNVSLSLSRWNSISSVITPTQHCIPTRDVVVYFGVVLFLPQINNANFTTTATLVSASLSTNHRPIFDLYCYSLRYNRC